MFKFSLNAVLTASKVFSPTNSLKSTTFVSQNVRYSSIFSPFPTTFLNRILNPTFTNPPVRGVKRVIDDAAEPHRLLRFDRVHGKRTSVKIVTDTFYRLHWGIWIRTRGGCHKRLHKKRTGRRRKLRQHVFCNAQQSRLLDKLTGPSYKRRHYYVDDEYEPYQSREEFLLTRRKPLPPTENVNVDCV